MFQYKVDVSKGESEIVQLHAFTLGYFWEFDQCKQNDRNFPCHLHSHYLYFNKNGEIWFSDDLRYFRNEREHMLITPSDFLQLNKK